jgi:predicted methyltransferase
MPPSPRAGVSEDGQRFPKPDRPVAPIVSDQYSDEIARDNDREAAEVTRLLGVRAGMAIADIGAGRGYYTVRLSPIVGPTGRIFANDIMPQFVDRLGERVRREGLANVTTILGYADDARLPPQSVDLALMVRMYHEVEEPYALVWRLHAALKPGGRVAVVEGDKPIPEHGMPSALLRCEMAAVGFVQRGFHSLPGGGGYLAIFEPAPEPPEPKDITPCRQ